MDCLKRPEVKGEILHTVRAAVVEIHTGSYFRFTGHGSGNKP